jgi:hypothetical protein
MVSRLCPDSGIFVKAAIFAEQSRGGAHCATITAVEGIIVLDSGRPGAGTELLGNILWMRRFGKLRVITCIGGRQPSRVTEFCADERHRSGCGLCEIDRITERIGDQAKHPAYRGIATGLPGEVAGQDH